MKYGYARVNTLQQNLAVQNTLKNEGCKIIYSEKFTGTRSDHHNLLRFFRS